MLPTVGLLWGQEAEHQIKQNNWQQKPEQLNIPNMIVHNLTTENHNWKSKQDLNKQKYRSDWENIQSICKVWPAKNTECIDSVVILSADEGRLGQQCSVWGASCHCLKCGDSSTTWGAVEAAVISMRGYLSLSCLWGKISTLDKTRASWWLMVW